MMIPTRVRSRRGANAVEFALVAPVLVMMLFGMMEYSWLFMTQITLDAAVAEGAQAAILVDPNDGDPGLEGRTAAQAFWDEIGLQGAPNFTSSGAVAGGNDLVTVTASLPYPSLFGGIVPTPGNIGAKLTARMESQ